MKEAISAMNGFDLGGQCIRVGPCVVPPSMHNIPTVAPGNASTALSGAKAVQEMLKKKKKDSGVNRPSPPKDSMADVLAIREEVNLYLRKAIQRLQREAKSAKRSFASKYFKVLKLTRNFALRFLLRSDAITARTS